MQRAAHAGLEISFSAGISDFRHFIGELMYPNTLLYINGTWSAGASGRTLIVMNPANGACIGTVACAQRSDLDRALEAAQGGFRIWRHVSALERSTVMRKVANLLRARVDAIASIITMEEGKTLAEARAETLAGADTLDWFAEESRRAYGRIIPSRTAGVSQSVITDPVGPVAAFTPWNFPVIQVVRKLAAALAAGCSIIIKASEETPASAAELIRACADAGVPPGVVNLVYGDPEEISKHLIPHPVIRKISFTGSVTIGKRLAALAGEHMKRVTMELGGHAPVIVFDDSDVAAAATAMAKSKFRNAGQVCVAPTRFLVQEGIYSAFIDEFVRATRAIRVGDGFEATTTMGPLANPRRLHSMEAILEDAQAHGGKILVGGKRIGMQGNFFEPTVVADLPHVARVMNEEPFGPLAIINSFHTFDEAVAEANRLPFGLAAYAWTRSAQRAHTITAAIEAGMVTINHQGATLPEAPFGGVKDSGYGSEGGSEALSEYLNVKFVSQAAL